MSFRKLAKVMLACGLIISSLGTQKSFAAENYDNNAEVITITAGDNVEEISLGNDMLISVDVPEAAAEGPSSRAGETITNVSKPITYNLFTPVSNYVAAPGTVSISKGLSTTVSASVTAGISVDLEILKANVDKTLGTSASFSTTQTISYTVPKGYKGRIVLRYSQKYYTFTINKSGKAYSGSGYTKAYDEYYTLQNISLT